MEKTGLLITDCKSVGVALRYENRKLKDFELIWGQVDANIFSSLQAC